ncbi:HlyD family secretion protein [Planctomicrobium sp. SH664]|uniref:HlyD family secretion protein n=1 Tax=Planctomicrobium sp. SH664 TaxID=3448125 RepID=UPI003F5B9258
MNAFLNGALKIGLPLLTACMLIFAIWHVSHSKALEPVVEPTTKPSLSPYRKTVSGSGMIEPQSENIAIGTNLPGIVAEVFVKEGDRVSQGARLFRLDDRQERARLKVAEAQLAQAQAELSELRAQPRKEQIPILEAGVRAAEATVKEREDDFQRQSALAKSQATTESQVMISRQLLENAQANLERAKADLALLLAGAWEPTISAAYARVRMAEANVEEAQTVLDRMTMCTYVAGDVLQVNIRPGEYVSTPSSEPLVLVGQLDPLHVRVNIDEYDIPRFEKGTPALGMLKGHPDKTFEMKFVQIEPYIIPKTSLTGRNTERVDTRVLQVIYEVVDHPENPPLYVGEQVDVFLNVDPERPIPADWLPGK